tara:strand:- start:1370 stop:1564 length:195 start_codon:yes stop_codon:yes gene_type:complete
MKIFKVQNNRMPFMDKFGIRQFSEITVTLHQPPYENEDILKVCGWKEKDVTITEMKPMKFEEDE